MDNDTLFAPWRSGFVLGKKEEGCPLCNAFKVETDSIDNLIVHRGKFCFVIMNKFPYNAGHLMVCPIRHLALFEELTDDESCEMLALARRAVAILKEGIRPQSFNLGIPEHIHLHIVPRWHGDTSFMAVVGNTKVVSISQDPIYDILKREFAKS